MKARVSGATVRRSARAGVAVFCISLIFASSAAFPQRPPRKLWDVLQEGLSEHSAGKRAAAASALGLLSGDPRAIELAEKALGDRKPAVQAAANALGQMGAKSSIPLLKEALADKENRVFFAAADSLLSLGPTGYDLYY